MVFEQGRQPCFRLYSQYSGQPCGHSLVHPPLLPLSAADNVVFVSWCNDGPTVVEGPTAPLGLGGSFCDSCGSGKPGARKRQQCVLVSLSKADPDSPVGGRQDYQLCAEYEWHMVSTNRRPLAQVRDRASRIFQKGTRRIEPLQYSIPLLPSPALGADTWLWDGQRCCRCASQRGWTSRSRRN